MPYLAQLGTPRRLCWRPRPILAGGEEYAIGGRRPRRVSPRSLGYKEHPIAPACATPVRMRLSDRFVCASAAPACGLALVLLGGCSSHGASPGTDATAFTIQTPAVTVAVNKERYVCYAETLDADLTIDRYDYAVVPFVHHVVLARTLAPEPEGLSECDVLFKTTWIPLLVSGKGSTTLQDPAGAATVLRKG